MNQNLPCKVKLAVTAEEQPHLLVASAGSAIINLLQTGGWIDNVGSFQHRVLM